jgi:hypothetical protein
LENIKAPNGLFGASSRLYQATVILPLFFRECEDDRNNFNGSLVETINNAGLQKCIHLIILPKNFADSITGYLDCQAHMNIYIDENGACDSAAEVPAKYFIVDILLRVRVVANRRGFGERGDAYVGRRRAVRTGKRRDVRARRQGTVCV